MKYVILTVSAALALTFTAGSALADMQPIPNPPEMHHHMMMWHHHHHHHHHHMGHKAK